MLTDRRAWVNFDENTAATHSVIAAPGAGKKIEIDHFSLLADGGANTVTLKLGTDTIIQADLNDNQAIVFDGPPHNTLYGDDNVAFTIQLSAATSVVGFIIYRVVGD